MKKTLTKDLVLSSGKVLKSGTEITTEKENSILLVVTKQKFDELEKLGYFKSKKKIINT